MSTKDKKATRAALRDFLTAIPGSVEQAARAMRWLVVLVAIALVAIVAAVVFMPRHPPAPPPGGNGDNPDATLYVRDLGRLPDGRHTFDLTYTLVLRNETRRPFRVDWVQDRIAIGTMVPGGDVLRMPDPPAILGRQPRRPQGAIAWSLPLVPEQAKSELVDEYQPGRSRTHTAHYRVNARAEQFGAIGIAYFFQDQRGDPNYFDHDPLHGDEHREQVQFGAVVRARCPLGVKIHNGETRSQCGS